MVVYTLSRSPHLYSNVIELHLLSKDDLPSRRIEKQIVFVTSVAAHRALVVSHSHPDPRLCLPKESSAPNGAARLRAALFPLHELCHEASPPEMERLGRIETLADVSRQKQEASATKMFARFTHPRA